MSYPKYQTPSIAGITMAFGPFPQQAIYDGVLSYHDDAFALAVGIGGTAVNAVSDHTLNATFGGIKPTDGAQPWVIKMPDGSWQFAGVSILQQVKANGGTIGNPGAWSLSHGAPMWIPTPPPPPPPTPVVNSSGDAAAFAAMLGVTTLTTEQFEKETLYWLRAIGHLLNITPPTA